MKRGRREPVSLQTDSMALNPVSARCRQSCTKKTSVEAISPLQLVTLQMAQWLWSQQPGGVTEEYFLKPAAGNGRLHAYAHGCLVNYVGARACYLLTRPATSLCGRWG